MPQAKTNAARAFMAPPSLRQCGPAGYGRSANIAADGDPSRACADAGLGPATLLRRIQIGPRSPKSPDDDNESATNPSEDLSIAILAETRPQFAHDPPAGWQPPAHTGNLRIRGWKIRHDFPEPGISLRLSYESGNFLATFLVRNTAPDCPEMFDDGVRA